MPIWTKVLPAVAPEGNASILAGFAAVLASLCEAYKIDTVLRQAHFLAQTAHESDGFKTTVEYDPGDAYEGRHDLGNTRPGDGRRFKGRGLIQITGRANYNDAGARLGVNLVDYPETAAQFPVAALTAGDYWHKRGINAFADADDLHGVTRKVNGGTNGLASRAVYLARAKAALAGQDMSDAQAQTAARDHLTAAATKAKAQAAKHKQAAGGTGMGGTSTAAVVHATNGNGWVTAALVAVAVGVALYFGIRAVLAARKASDLADAAKAV